MASKLNYARPATDSTPRSAIELMADMIAGSRLIAAGLFFTIVLAVVTEGWGYWFDEIFERPRTMVRRGVVRISRGREAARNYRP